MKRVQMLATAMLVVFGLSPLAAKTITLNWGDGQTIDIDTESYAADFVKILEENQADIEKRLAENNVSDSAAQSAVSKVNTEYQNFLSKNLGLSSTPYITAKEGLNDFSKLLTDVIPNAQAQQNVWANAWIGYLIPNARFGFGLNVGVAKLDMKAFKKTASALGIDLSDIRDTLVWPTVAADIRLGGIGIPFDIGFHTLKFNSSTIKKIGEKIDPITFDFFTIGGDIRIALIKGDGMFKPKLSVGGGVYYSKGFVDAEKDGSQARLDFTTTSIQLNAQASIKAFCFVPFVGTRVLFSKSNVDWKAKANWKNVLKAENVNADWDMAVNNILPTTFSGGTSTGFFDSIHPLAYIGVGIDLFFIDITASASYDFVTTIYSGAVSVRFAIN